MAATEVQGIDLFKLAGRSISGWIPSLKTGTVVRQPFCSQLEERLLMWLEYHPLVANYARGDIDSQFATTYRLPIPQHAPFTIGYTFENKPHHYLPDVVGTLANGKPFIAEAGMEDDKRGDRNLAKAEAARRLARLILFSERIFSSRPRLKNGSRRCCIPPGTIAPGISSLLTQARAKSWAFASC